MALRHGTMGFRLNIFYCISIQRDLTQVITTFDIPFPNISTYMPWVSLQCVIVVFSDHTHLLFLWKKTYIVVPNQYCLCMAIPMRTNNNCFEVYNY